MEAVPREVHVGGRFRLIEIVQDFADAPDQVVWEATAISSFLEEAQTPVAEVRDHLFTLLSAVEAPTGPRTTR